MNELKSALVAVLIACFIFAAGVGFGYLYFGKGIGIQRTGSERKEDAEVQRKFDESLRSNADRSRENEERQNRSLKIITGTGDLLGAEIQDIRKQSGFILSVLEEVGKNRYVLEDDNGRLYLRRIDNINSQ
ncbi:MAG: hypothetical protein LBD46_04735 [Endomicrobium sp.]|jgi:hypothetical protein|nr:hypothetical protein [Endomicrobium sp.]